MGGPSLHRNESLCKLAVARAQEVTLPLSHEGVHSVFHQRTFTTYCPLCDILGENLAHVFSIRSLPNLWVKSPEHKKLLEGPYNIGCVKIKEDSDNYYYVVLIVGKVY